MVAGGGEEEGVADGLATGREHLHERRLEGGELEGGQGWTTVRGLGPGGPTAPSGGCRRAWTEPHGTRTEMGGWGFDRSCSELYTSSFVWLGESMVRHS